ncbi:hypothetical protein C1I38_06085 [Dehalobacter sp. 12DCB1]|nr:hypothetical protein C1I36_00700 [Dehalobacter sp. 14DCB1]TCX54323.1 hypothetical protein C1I38_06085 [Dehalobacter sp. 12DCB1]
MRLEALASAIITFILAPVIFGCSTIEYFLSSLMSIRRKIALRPDPGREEPKLKYDTVTEGSLAIMGLLFFTIGKYHIFLIDINI